MDPPPFFLLAQRSSQIGGDFSFSHRLMGPSFFKGLLQLYHKHFLYYQALYSIPFCRQFRCDYRNRTLFFATQNTQLKTR